MENQSEDEATKIFKSSLVDKAQIVRPSEDDGNGADSVVNNSIMMTAKEDNKQNEEKANIGNKTIKK